MPPEFVAFPHIKRLSRECIVTEKIDGTNAQVCVTSDGDVFAGSRNRWITQEDDNYGFARWVDGNRDALRSLLGEGRYYGEWWGPGIQRGYGLKERKFSLFNVSRWKDLKLPWIDTVPVLWRGNMDTLEIDTVLSELGRNGSVASPGFMRPEGIVIYHMQSGATFKKTLDGDGHKGEYK